MEKPIASTLSQFTYTAVGAPMPFASVRRLVFLPTSPLATEELAHDGHLSAALIEKGRGGRPDAGGRR